jgi:hypothetical protein
LRIPISAQTLLSQATDAATLSMSKIHDYIRVLMLFGAVASLAQNQVRNTIRTLPKFEDYPAISVMSGKPAPPVFRKDKDTSPDADPKLREAVAAAAMNGPNFASKFTVVEISCGSGCTYIAVVNEESGEVFTQMPFYSLLVGPFQDNRGRRRLGGLSYRLRSRLLIAEGWFDSTSGDDRGYCAKAYYDWKGDHFRLIRRVPLDWQ